MTDGGAHAPAGVRAGLSRLERAPTVPHITVWLGDQHDARLRFFAAGLGSNMELSCLESVVLNSLEISHAQNLA